MEMVFSARIVNRGQISKDVREMVVKLSVDGLFWRGIAPLLDLSDPTIRRIVRKQKLTTFHHDQTDQERPVQDKIATIS